MNRTINLDELRKEIEEDRKNLAEKEELLETNLRYLEKKSGKPITYFPIPIKRHVIIDKSFIGMPLSTKVRLAIPFLKGKEFTRADIEDLFRQKGVDMDFPTSRITTELIKMEGSEVECKQRGTGRALSRYKATQD